MLRSTDSVNPRAVFSCKLALAIGIYSTHIDVVCHYDNSGREHPAQLLYFGLLVDLAARRRAASSKVLEIRMGRCAATILHTLNLMAAFSCACNDPLGLVKTL